jgi:hypothetical protein
MNSSTFWDIMLLVYWKLTNILVENVASIFKVEKIKPSKKSASNW